MVMCLAPVTPSFLWDVCNAHCSEAWALVQRTELEMDVLCVLSWPYPLPRSKTHQQQFGKVGRLCYILSERISHNRLKDLPDRPRCSKWFQWILSSHAYHTYQYVSSMYLGRDRFTLKLCYPHCRKTAINTLHHQLQPSPAIFHPEGFHFTLQLSDTCRYSS